MNPFSTIIALFFSPFKLFDNLVLENGRTKVILTYLAVNIIVWAIFFFAFLSRLALPNSFLYSQSVYFILTGTSRLNIAGMLFVIFLWISFGFFLTYLNSFLINLFAKLLNGKGNFDLTYKVYTYSVLPTMILDILPFAGLIGLFYSLFLIIAGTARIHDINMFKSIIAVLFSLLLTSICFVVASIFIGSFIQSIF